MQGNYYLLVSSASGDIEKSPLKKFHEENSVYLRMQAHESDIQREYSLDNKTWNPIGKILDGRILSTKAAGGFIGA